MDAQWNDEYEQMLLDCQRRDSKLSDWERGFIESIDYAVGHGGIPTPKQCEKLDQVWERVTS